MAQGRRKIPDFIKLVNGTQKKCRIDNSAQIQDQAGMVAPSWLPEECLGYFEGLRAKVETLGLNSDTYTDGLAMAAMRIGQIEECTAEIKRLGRVIIGDTFARANPAVAQLSDAMRHYQSLLAEFGLTPSSVGKVGAKKNAVSEDKGFGGL